MRTKLTSIGFVFLSVLLFIANLQADPITDPVNVIVGSLTFTRPEDWKWEEPTKNSVAVTRFVIPRPGSPVTTDIRFYIVKKDVSSEIASLLNQFPEASVADIYKEEIKIGKQKIVYFRVAGTYKYHDTKPKPNQLWIGAAVPTGKNEFIYARMTGPYSEVEKATSTFKKMMEDAVRDRDVN